MERIRWTEQSITFRSLVDDPAIKKPVLGNLIFMIKDELFIFLVQIGTKSIIVGNKFNGQFLMVSPYKVSKDRFEVMNQEFVLSSKHTGGFHSIDILKGNK
jgi:hypothetical protein